MKEISLDKIYVSSWGRYTKEELTEMVEGWVKTLSNYEDKGFTDVYVTISSTIDPYDDSASDVEIEFNGSRPFTELEQAQQAEDERISKLATKLGVSYYEASLYDKLVKTGKIKEN
jgi:hypothetical protein